MSTYQNLSCGRRLDDWDRVPVLRSGFGMGTASGGLIDNIRIRVV